MDKLVNSRDDFDRLCDGYSRVFISLPSVKESNLLYSFAALTNQVIMTLCRDNTRLGSVKKVFARLAYLGVNVLAINIAREETIFGKIKKIFTKK